MSNNSELNISNNMYNTTDSVKSKKSFDFSLISSKNTLRKKQLAPFLIKKEELKTYISRNGSISEI